jgi:hypothetical protein
VNKSTGCLSKNIRDNIDFICINSLKLSQHSNIEKWSLSVPPTTPCIIHRNLVWDLGEGKLFQDCSISLPNYQICPTPVMIVCLSGYILFGNVLLPFLELIAKSSQIFYSIWQSGYSQIYLRDYKAISKGIPCELNFVGGLLYINFISTPLLQVE